MKILNAEQNRQISVLENRASLLLRISAGLHWFCVVLAVMVVVSVLVGGVWAIQHAHTLQESAGFIRLSIMYLACGAGIGVMTVIGLDCLVADALISKAFELGDRIFNLKQEGCLEAHGSPIK